MKKVLCFGAVVAAALAFAPISARALTTIGFDDAVPNVPAVGNISWAGGVAPLLGTGIDLDTISNIGTPLNFGATGSCDACVLTFETGGGSPGTGFSGGGSLSIVGGATIVGTAPASIPADLDINPGTTLLSGTFIPTVQVASLGGTLYTVSGFIDAMIDQNLADFYGVENTGTAVLVQIAFNVTGDPINGFSATVTNTDLDFTPVPIPAALPLLLTALGGLGLIGRRSMKAQAAA